MDRQSLRVIRSFRAAGACVLFALVCGPSAIGQVAAVGEAFMVTTPPADDGAAPLAVEQGPTVRFALSVAPFQREVRLPALDVDALLAEDEAAATDHKRLRLGVERKLAVDAGAGAWQYVDGEGWLWTVAIVADGATGMRVHFAGLDLPEGAELFVRSLAQLDAIDAPIEGKGPWGDGALWTGDVRGGQVGVEYFVPESVAGPQAPDRLPFAIDGLQHLYRDIAKIDDGGLRAAGACNLDSACYGEPWMTLRNAVARITFVDGGTYLCSGQLLATTAGDYTPYFLTANHCISTQTVAQTMTAYWFNQRVTCGGSLSTQVSSSYANLVSTRSASDNTLLLIEGVLPAGLSWTGWTSTNPAYGTPIVCMHHPSGDWKRISFGNTQTYASSNFHEVVWSSGTTEGGSSGSGLWIQSTQQLIGELYGGYASCSTPTDPDYYGKFSAFYSQVSSALAAGADDDLEPNDSCAAAVAVSSGTYSTRVVKSVDEDWYKLHVPSCTRLTVTLTFTDNWGNINAQLYDACGGSVVASGATTTNNESFTYDNKTGDDRDYYLRVYLGDDTRNQYTLTTSQSALGGLGLGDRDCDGDIDLTDWAAMSGCLDGPSAGAGAGCDVFDWDGDGDVDLVDFAAMQMSFTG